MKLNLIVFDEMVVSNKTKVCKMISSQGKGSPRVCCVNEKQHCVQIAFSSNDITTLFIANIFQKKGHDSGNDCMVVWVPQDWKWTKPTPTTLFHHRNRLLEHKSVFLWL